MKNTGRTTAFFFVGIGIGAGLALLFAPQSGEETREWIADIAEREMKMLRRNGRRSMRELEHALTKGEEKVAHILKDGKEAAAVIASKLV